jgi:hypothetical protein
LPSLCKQSDGKVKKLIDEKGLPGLFTDWTMSFSKSYKLFGLTK